MSPPRSDAIALLIEEWRMARRLYRTVLAAEEECAARARDHAESASDSYRRAAALRDAIKALGGPEPTEDEPPLPGGPYDPASTPPAPPAAQPQIWLSGYVKQISHARGNCLFDDCIVQRRSEIAVFGRFPPL